MKPALYWVIPIEEQNKELEAKLPQSTKNMVCSVGESYEDLSRVMKEAKFQERTQDCKLEHKEWDITISYILS